MTTEETEAQRLDRILYDQPPLSRSLGIEVLSGSKDQVVARMMVLPEMTNRNGVMHGGAIMAFADNLGGTLASLHTGPDQITTTSESRTYFLRAVPAGEFATGTATVMHGGRRTMVIESRITRADGKLAAIVTQTQMMIPRER